MTPQSFQQAVTTSSTEDFLAMERDNRVKARALQSMALLMREVARERKRAGLRAASAICYLFDDRDAYCNFRFKANVPTESWNICGSSPTQEDALRACSVKGVMGVFPTYKDRALDDFTEDYAMQVVSHVKDIIERFCTPLDDVPDMELAQKCFENARAVAIDGALLKAARFLKEHLMPNLILVLRDGAHALRIACKEPLFRTDGFQLQQKRIFTDKHAVLKDIQFSNALKAKLEACQHLVVSAKGSQGGGLTHVIRHFSCTPIRFESMCAPQRAYACVILAVALLLADVASDTREDAKKRQRAATALEAMTEDNLIRTGLAGDWGEVSMEALRSWDVDDRDPTTEMRSLKAVREKMTALFLEGYVLCDPQAGVAAESRDADAPGSASASGSAPPVASQPSLLHRGTQFLRRRRRLRRSSWSN